MEETLIKDFSNLKDCPFDYYPLRNIRLMRLTDEEWGQLIKIMSETYKTGLCPKDLNEVFSSNNINFVREWLNKPHVEDEIYPKYYLLTSQVKKKQCYLTISDSQTDGESLMDEDFLACNPQYLGLKEPDTDEDIEDVTWIDLTRIRYDEEEMWDKFNIPVYAINRICEKILNPNGELDYYEVPDTFAINQYNRDVELTKTDVKNIDKFVENLNEKVPEGYDIVWDEEECKSPTINYYPAFGKPVECVGLRVYPKNLDRLKV